MHIFQALSASATGGVGQSTIWLRNLYEPLVELGHEVFLWQFKWSESRDRSEPLLDTWRREHARKPFDLFFSYFQDGMVEPGTILEIRKTGVPTCNFSCNNTHQFHLVEKLSPAFDFNLYAEKDAKSKFDKIGARGIWFPMAANPRHYKPYDVQRTIDASFVGQEYGKRYLYIWHLLVNGVDVHVYGPGWRRDDGLTAVRRWLRRTRAALRVLRARTMEDRATLSNELAHRDLVNLMVMRYDSSIHGPLSDEEMIRKYSESQMSLGFLEVFDKHDPLGTTQQHVHLREFEAPMSGALYCTGYCEELTEFYEPEKEVITYRSEHELLEKVRYYLAHPGEAERVRQAGRRRALESHTYQKRFQDLFDSIGLK
jgi:hypothetical protein